ncbi:MAG: hypothetical protein RBG13Loki_2160 [Promethearchaeota archaeon CR_4]|nr:MAG: hypothetical protein RBG13Loki_2160 [Candidatus Lokiarchaeota archaeon CR_4]
MDSSVVEWGPAIAVLFFTLVPRMVSCDALGRGAFFVSDLISDLSGFGAFFTSDLISGLSFLGTFTSAVGLGGVTTFSATLGGTCTTCNG